MMSLLQDWMGGRCCSQVKIRKLINAKKLKSLYLNLKYTQIILNPF